MRDSRRRCRRERDPRRRFDRALDLHDRFRGARGRAVAGTEPRGAVRRAGAAAGFERGPVRRPGQLPGGGRPSPRFTGGRAASRSRAGSTRTPRTATWSGTWSGSSIPTREDGIHLGILTSAGMTAARRSRTTGTSTSASTADPPRGGTTAGGRARRLLVAALKVADGALYASALETGAIERGRLVALRRAISGGSTWQLRRLNVVHSVAQFDGALFCGLGRFMGEGSALGSLPNRTPGGRDATGSRPTGAGPTAATRGRRMRRRRTCRRLATRPGRPTTRSPSPSTGAAATG